MVTNMPKELPHLVNKALMNRILIAPQSLNRKEDLQNLVTNSFSFQEDQNSKPGPA